MPLIKSAKKALKQSIVKRDRNRVWKRKYKTAIKNACLAIETKSKDADVLISDAYSLIDKVAKQNIIHKNKAARLKSGIAKKAKDLKIKLKKKSTSGQVQAKTSKKPGKKPTTKKSDSKPKTSKSKKPAKKAVVKKSTVKKLLVKK
jgi:small subunit ribosomal protein S20